MRQSMVEYGAAQQERGDAAHLPVGDFGYAAAMERPLSVVALALGLLGTPVMATEEPSFTVERAQGAYEVRDYPAMVVAEVTVTGDRKAAAGSGFRLLAGYIFGGNTRNRKIAMTAPVVETPAAGEKIAMTAPVLQTGSGNAWVVRFIMPRDATLATLPQPNDPKVHLLAVPATRVAVVRFSGLARDDDVAAKTLALSQFVKAQHLDAIGRPALAQYDPPWTPWFMRRNEMMIPVSHVAAR